MTKQRITEAFRAELQEKCFADISVEAVCARAGISKKTFYNHVETKQDLIPLLLEADLFQPIRDLRKALYYDQISTNEVQATEVTCRAFRTNYPLYRNIIASIGKLEFYEIMAELSAKLNADIRPKEMLPDGESQAELDYMGHFLGHASAATFRWWADSGFDQEPITVAEYYTRWALSHLHRAEVYQDMTKQTAKR